MLVATAFVVLWNVLRSTPKDRSFDPLFADLVDLDPIRRSAAEREVERLGVQLVPVLGRVLAEHRHVWTRAMPKVQSAMPQAFRQWDGFRDRCRERIPGALVGVQRLGPKARGTMAELRKLALSEEGEWAVPALEALAALREPWETVEDCFVGALRNSRLAEVRAQAAGLMGRCYSGQCGSALPALVKALADPYATVRVGAANAIGRMRQRGLPACDALEARLEDESTVVKVASAQALRRIGGVHSGLVPSFVHFLEHQDSDVRMQGAKALEVAGPAATEAIPLLITLLRDSHIPVQICAIEALGAMGPHALGAEPALREARNNNQSGVGRFVLEALEKIEVGVVEGRASTAR